MTTATHVGGSGRSTRRSWIFMLMALVLFVSSCNFAKDLKATGALQSRIQADIGVASNVSFRTHNGVTTVTVVLATLPPGDTKVTRAKVEALTRAEFPTAARIIIMANL